MSKFFKTAKNISLWTTERFAVPASIFSGAVAGGTVGGVTTMTPEGTGYGALAGAAVGWPIGRSIAKADLLSKLNLKVRHSDLLDQTIVNRAKSIKTVDSSNDYDFVKFIRYTPRKDKMFNASLPKELGINSYKEALPETLRNEFLTADSLTSIGKPTYNKLIKENYGIFGQKIAPISVDSDTGKFVMTKLDEIDARAKGAKKDSWGDPISDSEWTRQEQRRQAQEETHAKWQKYKDDQEAFKSKYSSAGSSSSSSSSSSGSSSGSYSGSTGDPFWDDFHSRTNGKYRDKGYGYDKSSGSSGSKSKSNNWSYSGKSFADILREGGFTGATKNDLKNEFKQRAKATHPDKNKHDPEATRKMQDLNNIWTKIKDHPDFEKMASVVKSQQRQAKLAAAKAKAKKAAAPKTQTTTSTEYQGVLPSQVVAADLKAWVRNQNAGIKASIKQPPYEFVDYREQMAFYNDNIRKNILAQLAANTYAEIAPRTQITNSEQSYWITQGMKNKLEKTYLKTSVPSGVQGLPDMSKYKDYLGGSINEVPTV